MMNNGDKILVILEEMRADISKLKQGQEEMKAQTQGCLDIIVEAI